MRDAAGLAGSLLLAPSPDTGPRGRQARTWALAGGRPTYRRGEGRKRSPPLQRDLEALVQQRSVLRARAGVSPARAPRRRGLHARSRNENKTPRTQRALWVPAALPPTAPRRWSERTANTMPPSSSGAARAGPSSLAAHPLSQGSPESWPVVFIAAESPRERASREASTSPTGGHSGQIWLLRAHPARVCERGCLLRNERFASGPLLFCQWQKRGRVTRDACPPGSGSRHLRGASSASRSPR